MVKKSKTLLVTMIFAFCFTGVMDQKLFAQHSQDVVVDSKTVEKLKKKVEQNLDSLSYHREYIKAMDIDNPELFMVYEKWMAKNPQNANIPFALGTVLANQYSPKARTYLLEAVKLNPNLKEAFGSLWNDAERWGDKKGAQEYLRKAHELDPEDASYAFYYASSFKNIDFEKYKAMSQAVARKFNQSDRGAQALYWLAHETANPTEKEAIYKQLKDSFAAEKFRWTSSGMTSYNDLLLGQGRFEESKALCQEMFEATKQESWNKNVEVSTKFIKYAEEKKHEKWQAALHTLDEIQVPRYYKAYKMIPMYKSEVMGLKGDHAMAYESLMDFYIKTPSPSIKDALLAIGQDLAKDKSVVQTDISNALRDKGVVATGFELKNYAGGTNSLADFRGQVTFITYWYPGCGPCRGEFPHLENIVKKYNKSELAYLGINISPKENDYVLPFMESTGYSFLPLEDFKGREKGNLDNRNAAPMNFIIDKKGNLIFSDFMINANNEDELELMIEEVLAL